MKYAQWYTNAFLTYTRGYKFVWRTGTKGQRWKVEYTTSSANFAANFLLFFSFLAQKMLKMTIMTSIWSAQHPNIGRNIQQVYYLRKVLAKKFKFLMILLHFITLKFSAKKFSNSYKPIFTFLNITLLNLWRISSSPL